LGIYKNWTFFTPVLFTVYIFPHVLLLGKQKSPKKARRRIKGGVELGFVPPSSLARIPALQNWGKQWSAGEFGTKTERLHFISLSFFAQDSFRD
jgi:hypothetical protein